ncbi:TrkH family potassium uptake protein [Nannocystis bainbridge]|uniref:Potassium transporter TrkG n=1 Tax=Nannocystis bainbridge TaxID=2995303 RepID=A0ABT5EEK7_9BACT|nr:potassium transporter TrkG [Nannocystis bainbridge]MDC0723257.1 potassium transporter TrkG [Nannocystis bainbridge]
MSIGSLIVLLVAVAVVALDVAVASPWTGLLVVLGMGIVTLAVAEQVRQMIAAHRKDANLGGVLWFEVALFLALLGFFLARAVILGDAFDGPLTARRLAAAETYDLVFTTLAALAGALVIAPERTGRVLLNMSQRPAMMLIGSFAALITLGSLLLTLPVSLTDAAHTSYVDSLFTMASAVCVTGLAVNDLGATYSLFGQGVILTGVQLGGIGIMTVAALALAFNNNSSLQSQLRYAAMLDARTVADLRKIVVGILAGTFIVEAIGAFLLWLMLAGDPRIGDASALWTAVFHAVSSFCNAGFALFPGGMGAFVGDLGVQVVVMTLMILGGLGFPVLVELVRHGWRRTVRLVRPSTPAPPRLSLATRVVLSTTLALIVAGTVAVLALEFGSGLAPAGEHGIFHRLWSALFISANTRSGGLDTVGVGAMRDATLLVLCVLMFIGGAPASTAGGIKTTTFATVVATLRAELRGREPELGGRALSPEVVRKATAVLVMMSGLLMAFILLLSLTEDLPFLHVAFEAVSALATVGLSTGITGSFSVAGKLILTAAMFLGRVGPFTIALAVADRAAAHSRHRLAREDLPVG